MQPQKNTTHDLTWKPETGKPRESTNPKNRITMREGIQSEISEATTSRSCFANMRLWSYTNSLTHTHTHSLSRSLLHSYRGNNLVLTMLQLHTILHAFHTVMIALSTYILVHLFRLFASIAHEGKFRLFTNMVFRVGYL